MVTNYDNIKDDDGDDDQVNDKDYGIVDNFEDKYDYEDYDNDKMQTMIKMRITQTMLQASCQRPSRGCWVCPSPENYQRPGGGWVSLSLLSLNMSLMPLMSLMSLL